VVALIAPDAYAVQPNRMRSSGCLVVRRKLWKTTRRGANGLRLWFETAAPVLICCLSAGYATPVRQISDAQVQLDGARCLTSLSFVHAGNGYARIHGGHQNNRPALIWQSSSEGVFDERNGKAVKRSSGPIGGIIAGHGGVPV